MGCVSSKSDDHYRPNVFQVWNVDDMGNRINPGEIVITESDLILYPRGRSPVRWPMRSVRRYGFDSELFSFESGRRCPTGPGVYAFKCRRAEALFTVLQEHIQSFGNMPAAPIEEQTPINATSNLVTVDEVQRPLGENLINITNSLEPRYCGCPCPNLTSGEAHGSESVQSPTALNEATNFAENQYVNGDVIQSELSNSKVSTEHEYVNTVVCNKHVVNTPAKTTELLASGFEHEYMNTGLFSETVSRSPEPVSSRVGDVNANTTTKTNNDKSDTETPAYCNIPNSLSRSARLRLNSQGSLTSPVSQPPEGVSFTNPSLHKNTSLPTNSKNLNGFKANPVHSSCAVPSSSNMSPKPISEKTVHYAILDLNGVESHVQNETVYDQIENVEQETVVTEDSNDDESNGKGYVTIDFDKTAALLNSTTDRQKQTGEIMKKS